MELNPDSLRKIAHLSRIAITDDEIASYTESLRRIFNVIIEMHEKETEHTKPLSHPLEGAQPLRADKITEENQRALLQENAPQVTAGLYIIPKFVDNHH
jgi:aspartyl-tRNA(Asn)/glutamyl-tRNA(Gln) amidotransferase subunit C